MHICEIVIFFVLLGSRWSSGGGMRMGDCAIAVTKIIHVVSNLGYSLTIPQFTHRYSLHMSICTIVTFKVSYSVVVFAYDIH